MKRSRIFRREWIRRLKARVHALSLAARHPDTPRLAKAVAWLVLAYALSPLDLIPDFIPVLGYVDDLIIVPLGLWLAISLIPTPIWRECLERAQANAEHRALP